MNEFETLLPPRRPAPRLPDRGGAASIVEAARVRRRAASGRAVGGVALAAVVAVGGVALRPSGADHGLDPGGPTRSPTALATTTPATRSPDPRIQPGVTSFSTPRAHGTAPTTPSVWATPDRPPRSEPPPWDGFTALRTEVGPPEHQHECSTMASAQSPTETICVWIEAPATVRSGAAADVTLEVCALDRPVMLDYPGDDEARLWIQRSADDVVFFEARLRPTGAGPHQRVIDDDTCVRYTFHWGGTDDDGRRLAPGEYDVCALSTHEWEVKLGSVACPRMRVTA